MAMNFLVCGSDWICREKGENGWWRGRERKMGEGERERKQEKRWGEARGKRREGRERGGRGKGRQGGRWREGKERESVGDVIDED